MSKKKIIVPAAYFCAWDGGVKLVKTTLDSLISYDKENNFTYTLLIPDNNFISFVKRIYNIFKLFFLGLTKGEIIIQDWKLHTSARELRKYFEGKKNLSIIGVDYINEKKFLDKGINLLSMNLEYHKNKIGYLFDFQHKYFPKFFSNEQKKFRDIFFKDILNSNNYIIVNSKKTKKDILKFYKNIKSKIFVLPFAPYLDFNIDILEKKNILGKYFIICNQFWSHKNFETAINAMKFFKEENCELLVTGNVDLKKNYNYFSKINNLVNSLNLSKKIKFLGNLEKTKQLSLMFNSLGVIQPSLFEGGPGGFSAYEAISLDKNLLLSDIEVNKEAKSKKIVFFKKKNAKDLFYKMNKIYKTTPKKNSFNYIKNISKQNKEKLGFEIFKILKFVSKNYEKQ